MTWMVWKTWSRSLRPSWGVSNTCVGGGSEIEQKKIKNQVESVKKMSSRDRFATNYRSMLSSIVQFTVQFILVDSLVVAQAGDFKTWKQIKKKITLLKSLKANVHTYEYATRKSKQMICTRQNASRSLYRIDGRKKI